MKISKKVISPGQKNRPLLTQIRYKNSGSILVSLLIIMIFLSFILVGLMAVANTNLQRARQRVMVLQVMYASESGADAAISYLNNIGDSYGGSGSEKTVIDNGTYKATFSSTVTTDGDKKVIISTGRLYMPSTASQASYTRQIEVIAQRTSQENASSILSRNIINIASGVKNITGRDIFANGYIVLNKNTTNLIAENITVSGKNTGASNCSIGGSGNLIKPSAFIDPSQTKTNIITAYNNCINPPGNNSNANFNVLANQNNISQIQSTYIPWGQFMDNSYGNSPTGCSDWSAVSPVDIPSNGNSKKTHYPDNASGVVSNCGTSGSVALGTKTYIIKNNVHIRANLCSASACSPTFYNPDPDKDDVKYIFVEGTINFNNLQSQTGSGPIVLISYGADTGTRSNACPLGDAVYLGNSGNDKTIAPAIYLLAMNGLCLDQTKFGATASLGGVGGKNIYVATNPGTPFDLALDTNFPVESIPVNLSWKAVRYRRI